VIVKVYIYLILAKKLIFLRYSGTWISWILSKI